MNENENVKECIICFDDGYDNTSSLPVSCDKLLNRTLCECEYFVHPECLDTWFETTVTEEGTANTARCLVCRSIVERKMSFSELITEMFETNDQTLTRICTWCYKGNFYAICIILIYVLYTTRH